MQYAYKDLGQRQRGDIVEVTLSGNQANVLLLDSSNYSAFRNRGAWRGVGGLAQGSPVNLAIPQSGHWYAVAYIPEGHTGHVTAGFRVLAGALPPIRQASASPARAIRQASASPLGAIRQASASPLGAIRQAADEYAESVGIDPQDKEYDVFISYASEDKAEVVRPLAEALRERGLTVWFDDFELRIGDSLRRKIDQGIRSSRFGVVVLSPSFFNKGWPEYELDGLVTIGVASGRSIILPVWHKVTKADVIAYSPSLADKLARSTSDVSIAELAAEIAGVVKPAEEEAD